MDLCYLFRDLLKLMYITENQATFVICCPTVLNGNVNIYRMCDNPLCTRWRNSCDLFSMFEEAFIKKKAKIDINICLKLQNQDGKITAVAIFPPEITDVFGEETLEEAKGNPVTFIQNISSVYAYVIGPL